MSFWELATDEKSAPVAVAVARSRRRVIKSEKAARPVIWTSKAFAAKIVGVIEAPGDVTTPDNDTAPR